MYMAYETNRIGRNEIEMGHASPFPMSIVCSNCLPTGKQLVGGLLDFIFAHFQPHSLAQFQNLTKKGRGFVIKF